MGLIKYILTEQKKSTECPKCHHNWDITSDDKNPYLCHNCGWDHGVHHYRSYALEKWLQTYNNK